jgi:hypothetical protein
MRSTRFLGSLALFGALATFAHGYSFLNLLYNTGVGTAGNELPTDTANLDPHYSLQSDPVVGYSQAYAVWGYGTAWDRADYVDPYTGTISYSEWISPLWNNGQPGWVDNYSPEWFNYTLSFNLGTDIPAEIRGGWIADNGSTYYDGTLLTTQILVNGMPTGQTIQGEGWGSWTPFALDGTYDGQSYFQTGTNTITFSVSNEPGGPGNPTGLRVAFTAADTAVPEPLTALGLGIGVVVRGCRRRRKPTV